MVNSSTQKEIAHQYPDTESLGLELSPGDAHYRAYVGPPDDYDLVAAMSMGLLTMLGLRQQHQVLDIGCGSLRVGRLLIPYLNRGGYTGLEPNQWLVNDGIQNEVGQSQVDIKQPRFVFSDSAAILVAEGCKYDYLLAQSIFSHCGLDLVDRWLAESSELLAEDGALIATHVLSDADSESRGWIYPECVGFTMHTLATLAQRHGLEFAPLDWHHPRQNWAVFGKPGFGADWYRDQTLSWNACFERLNARKQVQHSAGMGLGSIP